MFGRSVNHWDGAGHGIEGDMQRDKGGRMNDDKNLTRNSTAEFLIFTGQAGEQSIEARYEDETVWLSQKLMADLFDVDVRTVNEHLKNVYEQGEVTPEATIRKFRIVQTEGKREVGRNVDFYNLDAIISVGYRVNSVRATQFRQWAARVLREFAIKGYVQDNAKITAQIAKDFAEGEFEKYRIMQDRLFESDFDKVKLKFKIQLMLSFGAGLYHYFNQATMITEKLVSEPKTVRQTGDSSNA